jgi:hypothetical protein
MAHQDTVELRVDFIPLPPEGRIAWLTGLLLLIKFMTETCDLAVPILVRDFMSEVTHE